MAGRKGVWRVHVEHSDTDAFLTVHAYSEAEARRAAEQRAMSCVGHGAVATWAERVRDES